MALLKLWEVVCKYAFDDGADHLSQESRTIYEGPNFRTEPG